MSNTIYDDHGICIGVYCGPAGPKDPRRVQISILDEMVNMTYAEFCHLLHELALAVIEEASHET